jgi:hypothetical protein
MESEGGRFMPRRITVKLKVHKPRGHLCKAIDKVLGRDGTLKKKVWYFDPSDKTAVHPGAGTAVRGIG